MTLNWIDEEKFLKAVQVNPDAELVDVNVDGMNSFKMYRNFMKYPDLFGEIMEQFPIISTQWRKTGGFAPGWRQEIPPWAAATIVEKIREDVDFAPVRVFTNIFNSEMPMVQDSHMPHADTFVDPEGGLNIINFVFNLWLNQGIGGTAFWKYKGKKYVAELTKEEYEELYPIEEKPVVTWRNFRGDDDWELDTIAPIEYNSCLIYDGGFFHSPYIPEEAFLDEYRYSLVGMGIRDPKGVAND
tara:strand:+ start:5643 stop:6368 length:726 start_codon:yes stop_codon:yes gene_type:complete